MSKSKKADEQDEQVETTQTTALDPEQQARRISAQANGGGPWPPELLLERFVGARRVRRG